MASSSMAKTSTLEPKEFRFHRVHPASYLGWPAIDMLEGMVRKMAFLQEP
jgi:hypothetical protein